MNIRILNNIKTFGLIIFLLNFIQLNFAQSKTGTTIGQFLKIEPSSRIVGLGNAGASLSGEVSNIFFNPASLGRLEGTDIQFTFNKWLADINYNYMAAGINIDGVGTFALTGTLLNSGDMDVRTVENPLGTGEKFSVNDIALGLGYGLMLTDRVSVGLQINYINESIWHSTLSTFGLNFGVQYQVTDGGFTLGASVSNFGTRSSFDGRDLYINYDFDPTKYGDNNQLPAELRTDYFNLPTVFRAGVSNYFYFGSDYKLLVSADAVHPNDNDQYINIGGELTILQIISLRGGWRNLFMPDAEGGLVLGGGVSTTFSGSNTIRFDYAYAEYGRLSEAHRLTLSVGFK
jgi:hypothetical protein